MSFWHLTEHEHVAVLTFERPPRNFMSFAAMGELGAQLTDLRSRDDVNVVVLTGGTDGYFVAHADLDDLASLAKGEPVEGDPTAWYTTFELIETMPQPVVAAVNGQAWGGGCELSMACTLRVAAASAHFAQPEVNVGIIPGAGGTQRLPRLVGPGRAAELVLSGRVIDAEEAARIGLVQAVLPDDGFVERALEWVAPIAEKPRAALAAAKAAMHEGLSLPLAEALRVEGRYFLECQGSAEAIELEEEALRRYAEAGPDERIDL